LGLAIALALSLGVAWPAVQAQQTSKMAKSLGVTLESSVLARADQVIE
jgi:hypothetical protein